MTRPKKASAPATSEAIDRLLEIGLSTPRHHLSDIVSWHAHLPFVRGLIQVLEPSVIVELGVHKGDSLLGMAEAVKAAGLRSHLYGIDTWEGDPHAGLYDGNAILSDLMARAVPYGAVLSLIRSTFDVAVDSFEDGSIDLLHIDGLHTYEAVRHDFETWRKKLSDRAVVMFHDTIVRENGFEVWRYWDEVAQLGPSFNFPYGNGLGVLCFGHDVPKAVVRLVQSLREARDGAGRNPAALLQAVGEAFEAKSLLSVLNKRLQHVVAERKATEENLEAERLRLEDLLTEERRNTEAELARLENERDAERDAAKNEIDRLSRENADERQRAGAVLADLNALVETERTKAQEEFDRLNREISAREQIVASLRDEHSHLAEKIAQEREASAQAIALVEAELNRLKDEASAREALIESARVEHSHLAEQIAKEREAAAQAIASVEEKLEEERNAAAEQIAALEDRFTQLESKYQEDRSESLSTISQLSEEKQILLVRMDELVAEIEGLSKANADLSETLEKANDGIDDLHDLVRSERDQAQQEYDRLNALVSAERAQAQNEFDRFQKEIAVLHRDYGAMLQSMRLKSRVVRRFKSIAFPIWRLLPLPRKMKQRLRLGIVTRYGESLQIVPPKVPAMATQTRLALRKVTGRYLTLARSATGAPVNLPSRSVSIVIPVFNQLEYTLRCIESILLHSKDIEHEIIVVDDGSSDLTEIMLSARSDIIYIRNKENLGFIGACNVGLQAAKNTYVCFLNNDTEVTPNWLSALVDTFEMHPGVGLVGSQLIYPDGRLQEAGGIIWDDFSGWNWGRLQDPENPHYCFARHADYCSGAAITVPRAVLNAIGGFDPEFSPAYGEDSDMAFRLRAMGLSVLYQPLSRVVHYEGITSGTDVTQGVKAYQVVNAEKLKHRWAHVLKHQGRNGIDIEDAIDRGRLGRILVIDQITPEPDRDAGSITALELMLAMRDLGYRITFVPCSNFTYIPDYTDHLSAQGIESLLYPFTKSVAEHLEEVGDVYAAIVIFRVNTATDYLETVRKLAPSAKIIFHTSDLHFLREERAQGVSNPDVAERNLSASATKKKELAIIKKSNVTIVHSHYEAELLAKLVPNVNVVVFPWVYEARSEGKPFEARKDMVFLGGYRHYPNTDAILHYAQDIVPQMEKQGVDLTLRAIGADPPKQLTDLQGRYLKIEGFVEDLEPILGAARFMLVPLRYGAGLKGKIVSAMAHGLPVITTSIGAEGMGLTDGVDVLVANSPDEMISAMQRLSKDKALWERLRASGLDYVSRTTSRRVGFDVVRRILGAVDLPVLPIKGLPDAGPLHHAMLGTPSALSDLDLIAAALSSAPPTKEKTVLILSDEAFSSLRNEAQPEGVSLCRMSDVAGCSQFQEKVALVDAFDDEAVAGLVDRLPSLVGRPDLLKIGFVPPVVGSDASGYSIRHALTGRKLGAGLAQMPSHLRHAAQLARLGGEIEWTSDVKLTGFPGMTVAIWKNPSRH